MKYWKQFQFIGKFYLTFQKEYWKISEIFVSILFRVERMNKVGLIGKIGSQFPNLRSMEIGG